METGLPAVHRFLVQHYNLDELHTLCFDLGVNYDDLAGATLSGKARELVLWAGRQRKLDQLLAALRAARPTPFEQAGLHLEPSALEGLYGDLDAFESSTAPQSAWTRLRSRPWIFYPSLALIVILALVLLAAGLVSITGGMAGAQQQLQTWGLLPTPTPTAIPLAFTPEGAGEVLVVIATFQRLQGVIDVGAQDEIRSAIQQAAGEAGFANLRTEVEPAQLAAGDQKGARALGERYGASMVIWGEISGVRVTVNYLNLKQPDFDAAQIRIEETERTQLANPSAYSSFITQDLPGQMTFLALFAVGQSLYSQERYSESIGAIERAIAEIESGAAIEGLAEAYLVLGFLYQVMPTRDIQRGIAIYTKAIELAPDDPHAYDRRGLARYNSGDLAGAIADYTKAIELKPDDEWAYYGRGLARYDSGDLAGAITDYTKAIELKPDDEWAYYYRGLARYDSGDLAGAIADYDKAIELEPDNDDAYIIRGAIRYDSGDSAGAIADLTKAIELAPDSAISFNNLCWTYALLQQAEQALPYCERAVEINPQPPCRDSRGLAYAQLGRYDAAIADFQAFIDWLEQQPDAENQAMLARRKEWVTALRAGQNPFTPEVLAELRFEN